MSEKEIITKSNGEVFPKTGKNQRQPQKQYVKELKMNYIRKSRKIAIFTFGSLLFTTGILLIPSIIQKLGNKRYRRYINTDKIDFDDMGPEIVPYDIDNKEEE